MRIRTTLFFIASLSAVFAEGGMVLRRNNGVQVAIEGNAYRLELPPATEPRPFDVVVSQDADTTATCINVSNRTWFERRETPGATQTSPGSSPFTFTLEKDPLVEESDEPGGEIAGHLTRKHSVRVRFSVMQTFRQSKLRLSVDATIVVWSAPDLARVMTPSLQTTFPAADSALAAALARVPGLPLGEMTSVTRTYEGGKPFTTTQEWTTTSILAKTIGGVRVPSAERLCPPIPSVCRARQVMVLTVGERRG
jgi:hypothetical protein